MKTGSFFMRDLGKKWVLFFIIIPALVVGCGRSGSTNDNNKDFFGDDVNQNSDTSVVDVLLSDSDFDSLNSLLIRADLATTLDQRREPFTIFAPTDQAFARLSLRVRRYLDRNPSVLREVLLYHVVSREYSTSQIQNFNQILSLQGERIRVRNDFGTLSLNRAQLIRGNDFAGNGVIHAIDRVMIPPSLRNFLNNL